MVRWTLLLVVLIIFASGAVAFYTVFFRPSGEVVVPLLRERSVVDAVAELERLGLVAQIEQVASTLPEGRVLGQSPEPGTRTRKKQVIVLQISKGGELHAVPDVRGQTLARAQSVIKEQGFTLGDVIRIRDRGQPGGAVIAQSPASPANIPVARKIDLLVREGPGGATETVTIPDVNRMTEKEARNLLEATGLKIQTVDRVYSPLMPEGLAIETRPGAGTAVKTGEGVRLKIATLRRPAGYVDAEPDGGNVRRAATPAASKPAAPADSAPPASAPSAPSGQGVTVSVKGQGDILIGGEASSPAGSPAQEAAPSAGVIDQERQAPRAATPPAQVTPAPVNPSVPTVSSQGSPQGGTGGSGSKMARIRYQVPPLSSPLNLRIELTDPTGRRDVLNRQAKSGESVYVEAPYSRECVVSIYLGGDFVWQEKHQ